MIDVVEAFTDFDRDACGWTDEFDAFDSACEEDAENVLPALPVLWVFLGHGLKAVEQDFKEFCVGGAGMLLAELLEELGELFGFFEVGCWSVIMVLDANLISCDRDIARVEIADAVDVESGLVFGLVSHDALVEKLVFVLGDDVDDGCGINVGPIRFGIDSDEDDFVLGF